MPPTEAEDVEDETQRDVPGECTTLRKVSGVFWILAPNYWNALVLDFLLLNNNK